MASEETIIAALISAFSAIIVALINYRAIVQTKSKLTEEKKSESTVEKKSKPTVDKKTKTIPEIKYTFNWIIWSSVTIFFVFWLIYSSIYVGGPSALNYILILAATIVMSAIWPINPLTVVSIILILHPINIIVRPLYYEYFIWASYEYAPIYQLIAFAGNALAAYYICKWRISE